MQVRGMNCCGAVELIGINDIGWTAKKWLIYYATQWDLVNQPKRGKAFLPFCYAWDVAVPGAGYRSKAQGEKRLAAFKTLIEDNKLGTVTIMDKSSYNPNYGHRVRIRAGIWVPNNKAISKYVYEKKWIKRTVGGWFK